MQTKQHGYFSWLIPGKMAQTAAAVGMRHMSVCPPCVAGKPKIICCCGEQCGTAKAGHPVGGGAMLTGASMHPCIPARGGTELLGFSCGRVDRNLLVLTKILK